MAAFLPAGRTEASRFMLQQLQGGAASSLILVGIEGAPPAELARISTAMASALSAAACSRWSATARRRWTGRTRHGCSRTATSCRPGVTAEAFTADALRADFGRLLAQLRSSASPLAAQFGLPDPTGALLAMAPAWVASSAVRTVGGVWFAPERDRALLLLQTAAPGMDIGAQDAAEAAIQAAFAAAPTPAERGCWPPARRCSRGMRRRASGRTCGCARSRPACWWWGCCCGGSARWRCWRRSRCRCC